MNKTYLGAHAKPYFKIVGSNAELQRFEQECIMHGLAVSKMNSLFRDSNEHCLMPAYAFDESQPDNIKLQTLAADSYPAQYVFQLPDEYIPAIAFMRAINGQASADPVDYRLLLHKYMTAVCETEGVTFVNECGSPEFSEAEQAALQAIASQYNDLPAPTPYPAPSATHGPGQIVEVNRDLRQLEAINENMRNTLTLLRAPMDTTNPAFNPCVSRHDQPLVSDPNERQLLVALLIECAKATIGILSPKGIIQADKGPSFIDELHTVRPKLNTNR